MIITILKGYTHFNSLRWVALAVSKDQTKREALTYINVETDDTLDSVQFTATDGHRLHRFTFSLQGVIDCGLNFETGLYSVNKISKSELQLIKNTEEGEVYPEVEKIMPNLEGVEFTPIKIRGEYPDNTVSSAYARAIYLPADKKCSYSLTYFKDFIDNGEHIADFAKVIKNDHYCLVLKTFDKFGLIMPLNFIDD